MDMEVQGNFIITWDDDEIYGQRFDVNGNKEGDQFQVNLNSETNTIPSISMDDNCGFMVSWINDLNGDQYVFGRRFFTGTGEEFQDNTFTTD